MLLKYAADDVESPVAYAKSESESESSSESSESVSVSELSSLSLNDDKTESSSEDDDDVKDDDESSSSSSSSSPSVRAWSRPYTGARSDEKSPLRLDFFGPPTLLCSSCRRSSAK